jgi:hypothetical protein
MSENFLSKTLRKGKELGWSVARGVPQMATGFVDILGMPLTATGLVKPEEVFGSTDYLTNKGLLPPRQEGLDNETTELVSSALSPAGAAKAGIGGLAALAALGVKKSGKPINEVFERTVAAPKEIDAAKRYKTGDKKGIYRGSEAFGGINPQKLAHMRADYLRKMEEGVEGRLWYDKASKDIFRLVGQDPEQADKLANALAITSAGTGVSPNFMHGAKAWNQNAVGDPVKAGRFPNDMGRHIDEAFANPEASATGLKRNPFSAGLSVEWRGPEFANRATHDIWDVRAWGIKDPKTGKEWSKGIGDAGHRFLDEQSDWVTKEANRLNLGGVSDWLPYRSQAAPWVVQSAKDKGIPLSEASKHYGDFINNHSAQVTREWVPGDNTNHLPELLRSGANLRRNFSDDLENVVKGPDGIDLLANRMGALSDRVQPNRGVYEGQTNKGYASIIPAGKIDDGGGYITDNASERLLDAVAAGHGLLGVQKQSAWNHLTGKISTKKAGGYQIKTGQPFAEDELARLNQLTDDFGADIPQVDPRGARILEFAKEGDPSRTAIVKALRKAYPDAEIIPQSTSGNLFPAIDEYGTAPEKWSAKPYIEKIEAGGPKVVAGFDEAAREMSPQLLAKTEKWAAENNLTQAPWYRPMMEALSTGGLTKLKELVEKGIVPVVALGALGAMTGKDGSEEAVY